MTSLDQTDGRAIGETGALLEKKTATNKISQVEFDAQNINQKF